MRPQCGGVSSDSPASPARPGSFRLGLPSGRSRDRRCHRVARAARRLRAGPRHSAPPPRPAHPHGHPRFGSSRPAARGPQEVGQTAEGGDTQGPRPLSGRRQAGAARRPRRAEGDRPPRRLRRHGGRQPADGAGHRGRAVPDRARPRAGGQGAGRPQANGSGRGAGDARARDRRARADPRHHRRGAAGHGQELGRTAGRGPAPSSGPPTGGCGCRCPCASRRGRTSCSAPGCRSCCCRR